MNNDSNYKHYTRGGQISFHNLRMWDQITKTLTMICLFLWVLSTGLITCFLTSQEKLLYSLYHFGALCFEFLGQKRTFLVPYEGRILKHPVALVAHHPFYVNTAKLCLEAITKAALIGFGVALTFGVILAIYFVRNGKKQTENQFIRGTSLVAPERLKKEIIKKKVASDLRIDGLPLILGSEVQHLLVHGTVGMGKSQFIMKLLDSLRARGDRVIVYDKGCTFTEHYFNSDLDVLLNPFDARCVNWDLWMEAPRDELLENMAESLIPAHGDTDPFWVNAARTVFSCVASKMRSDPERSLDKLMGLLVTGQFEALEPYLEGTAASTLVSSKIEKTAISIRSVITTYLKSMQTLHGLNQTEREAFSIRDYILHPDNRGWLFISSNGEQHKSLKPLISMWIAMASLTLLSLPEDNHRRIWFICDELPSLHKLPLLGETIAEVRKFGGCFLLGMQSFSQLVKVYGRSGASEIFDLLNTRAFFASPSHEMAQLVSKELGEEEVDDTRENYSYGANSIRDGISLGKNRITRPLVTYPEIMSLDPLTCYLRLPGNFPMTRLKLTYEKRGSQALGFISRTFSEQEAPFYSTSNPDTEREEGIAETKLRHPKESEDNVIHYLD